MLCSMFESLDSAPHRLLQLQAVQIPQGGAQSANVQLVYTGRVGMPHKRESREGVKDSSEEMLSPKQVSNAGLHL